MRWSNLENIDNERALIPTIELAENLRISSTEIELSRKLAHVRPGGGGFSPQCSPGLRGGHSIMSHFVDFSNNYY